MTIYENADDKAGIASSYHNIGYIESEQLNYPAAVIAFKKAIMLRETIKDRFGVAETRNNLGMLLSDMEQHEQALTVLLKALPILEALNTRKQIAATYDSIGSVYNPRKISCSRFLAQVLDPTALQKNTRLTYG